MGVTRPLSLEASPDDLKGLGLGALRLAVGQNKIVTAKEGVEALACMELNHFFYEGASPAI